MKYAFFGSARISSLVLSELKKMNLLPSVIITSPDRKKGRGMRIAPNEVKILGLELNIPVLSPDKLDADFVKEMVSRECDIFLVAGYGKILPKNILDIPSNGSLNIHPSSLPKYRGPSPIESAILSAETKASCCLMLMDEQMDHGPIIAEKTTDMREDGTIATTKGRIRITEEMASAGAELFAGSCEKWIAGEMTTKPQDHAKATFTKKIKREDGEIKLGDEAVLNFLRYKAYEGWPGTFFFIETDGKKRRIIIKKASLENDRFVINKVLPEGGRETDFKTLAKSHPETNHLL